MVSFSVVTNIASVNAQANLDVTHIGLRTVLRGCPAACGSTPRVMTRLDWRLRAPFAATSQSSTRGCETPTTGCPRSRSRTER